jgi:hypothetical protein
MSERKPQSALEREGWPRNPMTPGERLEYLYPGDD